MEIFSTYSRTNKWMYGDQKFMDARTYIKGIKLRTNTLETRVTCLRGQDADKKCRLCHDGEESLMHILQMCAGTKGKRYSRHHNICNKVANKLREGGFTVLQEESYQVKNMQANNLRPDIVAIKDKKANILDVTVVYERSGASFIDAYQKRVDRYRPIMEAVMERHDCNVCHTQGLTVGARGSLFHKHINVWKQLGLTDLDLDKIAISRLRDSISIYNNFMSSVLRNDQGSRRNRNNSKQGGYDGQDEHG